MGGSNQSWETFAYKVVEAYDPSTNTWTRKKDMPTAAGVRLPVSWRENPCDGR